jgi:ATP phosphoribosyltransferase
MSVLRIAVPNKGRLQNPSADLLSHSGMRFEKTARSLSVPVSNVDIELLFVRTEDIPELVADGVAGMGITGLDLLEEAGLPVEVELELGYGGCRLAAAVPQDSTVEDVAGFAGLRIATSHPAVTKRFFADKGIDITTVPLRGSVEVAPRLDVADAIVDLVSSGSTMRVNGLRPVVILLESQAVLIRRPDLAGVEATLAGQVTTMVRSVLAARRRRYVLMNAPIAAIESITAIIPGLEAPTIVPLAEDGMVALHSVVDTDEVWRVLPRLEDAGATGILVLPIDQLIP